MARRNTASQTKLDLLQVTIGDFGRWQCRISTLMALLKFPIAWFQLGIVFLAPPTEFWCNQPNTHGVSSSEWKNVMDPPLNMSYYKSPLENGVCGFIGKNKKIIPCERFEYNLSVVHSSIITEWDLVCGRAHLVDVAQVVLMFGVLLGNVFFGIASDKFGRKRVLIICIFLQSICGTLSATFPWYGTFLLFRFLLAIANGGTMITSFVMCMEVVGGTWRAIVPILYQIPFGAGNSLMAGFAYIFRDWREFQFVLSGISAFYVTYLWLIPESPRWLLAVGRRNEAIKVLEDAARCNSIDPEKVNNCITTNYKAQDADDKSKFTSLFKTTQLRRRTTLLCVNWLLCGVSFYSFSQYLGRVTNDLYLTVAVGGIVSIPGTLLCIVVIRRCGRRWTIACAQIFTSLSFLSIILIPQNVFYRDWPRMCFAAIGVIGMSVSFPALYLFTGELFPTIIRNAGVGTAAMCARIGSILAPLVIALNGIAPCVPLLVLGVLGIIEALLVFPLPETLGSTLPETIADAEEPFLKSKVSETKGTIRSPINKMEDDHMDS